MSVSAAVLLTGVGLAAAAGLNAYIPLLIAGLLAHFGVISLTSPYDLLQSWPALIILAVLLTIEIVADKLPAAVLFAGALAPDSQWTQALGLIAGLVTAGSVHAAKATVRPVANVSTGGLAAPVLSTIEDLFAVALSLVAILVPVLVIVLLVVLVLLLWRGYRRVRAKPTATSMPPNP